MSASRPLQFASAEYFVRRGNRRAALPAAWGKISCMGGLLQKAMAETAKLPEAEQEAVGAWILAELESERRWDELFAKSQDLLSRMAEEARQEYRAGLTEPLDPEKL